MGRAAGTDVHALHIHKAHIPLELFFAPVFNGRQDGRRHEAGADGEISENGVVRLLLQTQKRIGVQLAVEIEGAAVLGQVEAYVLARKSLRAHPETMCSPCGTA